MTATAEGGAAPITLFSGSLETLRILSDGELINALLNVTVHESRKVVHGPVDAVICR